MYYNRIHAPVQQKPRIYAGKSLFLWEKQLLLRLRRNCGGSHLCNSVACGGSRLHHANRGSAALISALLLSSYRNNNLGWCEAPLAVEHPRDTENPPGTPSGRRPRLETILSPVERLFPLFKGRNSERLRWRMKRGISTAAVRKRKNSESRSVSGERQRGKPTP